MTMLLLRLGNLTIHRNGISEGRKLDRAATGTGAVGHAMTYLKVNHMFISTDV
jgi:hypothetical protein